MNSFRITVFIILTFLLFAGDAFSQFIADKTAMETNYQNYSGRNYENYSSTFIKKKFFDNFGNFLIEGTTVYELNEVQKQAAGDVAGGTSDLVKSRFYQNYFNNLIIGSDSYGGFETRLMVGDAIRTKFTSLTLDRARFNGIRWDAGTAKYRGTMVVSRVSDPIRFRFDRTIYSDGVRRVRDWTQYLFGGHFETDIGDMLTLGVTYVNQHQRRSSIDSKESSLEGVVANVIPRMIFLKISDDSPGDNSGPIVYSPPTIIINGRQYPTVNIYGKLPTDASTSLDQPIQYYELRTNENNTGFDINDKTFFRGADTTSFTRIVNYKDRYSIPPSSYPYQVSSSSRENKTYAFLIPKGVESVQFKVMVANDFKIETAQDWVNNHDEYLNDARWVSHANTDAVGRPTPFFVKSRAEGNVRDASNKQVVTINYGLATGMSIYGLNFKFSHAGFDIEGEFNQSVEYLKYPLLSGNRFENKGEAWYIRGKKKIGRFTIGAERYRISPDYITWLNTYVLENSYYADPNQQSLIPTPILYPEAIGAGYESSYYPNRLVLFPGGAFYPLVDDNDDNDRWEDGFYHYQVQTTDALERNKDIINGRGDYFKLGYRQNINELRSLADIIRQPDAGIFPGKDRDNDGIPDDDRNADGIPDYAQDFLTYYADPPSFDYGDDWNNNGVIDEQENDILPDYPYDPDIDGYHVFTGIDLLDDLNIRVGKINEEGIARGGINDVNYLRSEYYTETPKFGSLRLFYVLKQVQDNIPNDGYQFKGVITTNNPFPEYTQDPLNYRNSLVNSLYLGTKYTQIKNLNIENNVRIELNKQFALGSRMVALNYPEEQTRLLGDQMPGRIVFWGIVNKIDYTLALFNNKLKLSPQLKIRTEKIVKTSEDANSASVTNVVTHQQEFIPIFRVDYSLTSTTDVRFGVQGFSFFRLTDLFFYKIRNYKDNVDSQDRSTIAFSISNKTQYGGYNVVMDFGIKHTNINFIRSEDAKKGTEESLLFFSIYAGF
ncbi:MAG: hypothetical protein K8H86_11190 [Ignavibacteriaceae bacterium]|nr:hypothetical protein [Ignavibacteriaceae bacterium]